MIYKVLILAMALVTAFSLMGKWTVSHEHPYVPLFKAKECFVFHNHKDGRPDGMVIYTKDQEYVVMWTKEAERRYAGPKLGGTVPMKWMDLYASHVTCPPEWAQSRRTR